MKSVFIRDSEIVFSHLLISGDRIGEIKTAVAILPPNFEISQIEAICASARQSADRLIAAFGSR